MDISLQNSHSELDYGTSLLKFSSLIQSLSIWCAFPVFECTLPASAASLMIGVSDGMDGVSWLYFGLFSCRRLVSIDNSIPFNPNYYLLPFAIVVGVCFILMVIFMVAKWLRDIRKKHRSRLSKSHLKKIPIKKFKKGEQWFKNIEIILI
jgi:uncharacterized membrane protein